MKKAVFVGDEHWYDLEQSDDKVSIYYSSNECWTNPSTHIFSLVDVGDGYKLEGKLRKNNHFEYDEVQELYILLSAIKDTDIFLVENMKEL